MTTQVLIAVADGVEDIETVTLIDVLRRAELEVCVASVGPQRQLTCARGTRLIADAMLVEVQAREFAAVLLPGGLPGAEHLAASADLAALVQQQAQRGGVFGAICAAPALALHAFGVLDGRQVTCYPAFAERLTGCTFVDAPVVEDGPCITSQGPATAMAFALAVVARLRDADTAQSIAQAMLYR
ncbi:DJ-1 family glyoxalase III [Atopomonas sediminilitoris]|uniref:DJ-1 family glyoxalase III n=1 Tax=Atopomonas sediminilitoris TaxID=2919919 RepID=UPI001F4D8A14|nr:DJ-1 family glyoxalase III [Atopomonas sediminilitoris]MCJ8170128.1 DJ-1/PfpI family protein [Atopomonas sediminilitoris]